MENGVQDLSVYFCVHKIGIRPQLQHYIPPPTRGMQSSLMKTLEILDHTSSDVQGCEVSFIPNVIKSDLDGELGCFNNTEVGRDKQPMATTIR